MTPAWEDMIEREDREAIANWSAPYQLGFLTAKCYFMQLGCQILQYLRTLLCKNQTKWKRKFLTPLLNLA